MGQEHVAGIVELAFKQWLTLGRPHGVGVSVSFFASFSSQGKSFRRKVWRAEEDGMCTGFPAQPRGLEA